MSDQSDTSVLSNLALIFIAFAHSTDDQLSDSESDAIAERLQSWTPKKHGSELEDAVEDALRNYVQEDATERLNRAISAVRNELDRDLRQNILDDLTDIALADGTFLFMEGSFIGELADAWDLRPEPSEEEGGSWSVLSATDGSRRSWTPVHDLALVYLTLAHRADDHLSVDEVDEIAERIQEWIPDASYDDALQIVKDALRVSVQDLSDDFFARSVQALGRSVPEHQHEALLDDLQQVARADGEVQHRELRMIEQLCEIWDIPRPTS